MMKSAISFTKVHGMPRNPGCTTTKAVHMGKSTHWVRRQHLWYIKRCAMFFRKSRVNKFSPDRKSTRLNSSHVAISYAVFCLKKKKKRNNKTLKTDQERPKAIVE